MLYLNINFNNYSSVIAVLDTYDEFSLCDIINESSYLFNCAILSTNNSYIIYGSLLLFYCCDF